MDHGLITLKELSLVLAELPMDSRLAGTGHRERFTPIDEDDIVGFPGGTFRFEADLDHCGRLAL
jgi:hypothetical protein